MMSLLIQMALPVLILVLFAASGISQNGLELQQGDQLALPGGAADLKLSNSGGTDENLDKKQVKSLEMKQLEVQEQKKPETTTESLNFGNEATFETKPPKPEVKSTTDAEKKKQKQRALELNISIIFFTGSITICLVLLYLMMSYSEPA
ncbi:uncharacterized protein LOC135943643 [Cloeon dipterum]|uniref:uncharacterized protein LOC135943643 n=1 Tax=Cloeon dipterum TaxID=197152 RepID=UPI00322025CF